MIADDNINYLRKFKAVVSTDYLLNSKEDPVLWQAVGKSF